MKLKFTGSRPKLVTFILSPGDTLDLSSEKTTRKLSNHRDFTEESIKLASKAADKPKKAKKATNAGLTI